MIDMQKLFELQVWGKLGATGVVAIAVVAIYVFMAETHLTELWETFIFKKTHIRKVNQSKPMNPTMWDNIHTVAGSVNSWCPAMYCGAPTVFTFWW